MKTQASNVNRVLIERVVTNVMKEDVTFIKKTSPVLIPSFKKMHYYVKKLMTLCMKAKIKNKVTINESVIFCLSTP